MSGDKFIPIFSKKPYANKASISQYIRADDILSFEGAFKERIDYDGNTHTDRVVNLTVRRYPRTPTRQHWQGAMSQSAFEIDMVTYERLEDFLPRVIPAPEPAPADQAQEIAKFQTDLLERLASILALIPDHAEHSHDH